MCQKRTDSQKPLSGAWAKVQGHATAQLQLSNQSPTMCQLGLSVMKNSLRHNYKTTPNPVYASATQPSRCSDHRRVRSDDTHAAIACDMLNPAQCPEHALMARIPLGLGPSLHQLRSRSLCLVRPLDTGPRPTRLEKSAWTPALPPALPRHKKF